MDVEMRALLAGILAGLAVAIPLGAISVLILQQALSRGWQAASAAATGVALVDLAYATLATAAGTAVAAVLTDHSRVIQLTGAVVLVAVATHGLVRLRTSSSRVPEAPTDPQGDGSGQAAVLRRFIALTAINPLTAVYFTVLAAGLGTVVAGMRAATAFVAGVFIGSWTWQLVLAGAGSFARARLPSWARTATGLVGYLMVLGYAARLAAG